MSRPLLLLATAACAACVSCGEATRGTSPTNAAGAGPAADASGGAGNASDRGGGSTGSAGAPDYSIDIDASDCAERPLSDCAAVDMLYQSNGGFEQTPAFAECDRFNTFDHCGTLQFAFDAEGCAISVSDYPRSEHLSELSACLDEKLRAARFPCLASGALRYEESCLVR